MGEAVRYGVGPHRPRDPHRRYPARTVPWPSPGKAGLVAEHQVATGDAPAVKHLVSDLAISPGGVDQIIHVLAVLDLLGKEGQLV